MNEQPETDFALVPHLTPEEVRAIEAAKKKAALMRNIGVSSDIREMIEEKLEGEPQLQLLVYSINRLVMEHEAGRASGASVKKDEECLYAIRELLNTAKRASIPLIKIANSGDSIYQYNGTYWKRIDPETVRAMLPLAAYKAGVKFSTAYTPSFIDDLGRQLLDLAHVPAPLVNTSDVKINLKNTTLHIRSGIIATTQHNKQDRFKYCLSYDYTPGAGCPVWQKHLDRVLPDKDTQAVLQEFIAWCLIPHEVLNMEAILFMTGDGSNGKSTVQKVITAILGKENVSGKSLSDLSKSTNSRLELQDKLANIAGETKTKFDSDFFKSLASGEAIEAKRLYQNTFTMIGGPKHIFAVNERPRDIELTHGFFRKYLEIPFNEKLAGSEKILNYEKILYAELPGILNWVLEGVVRLMTRKEFTHSEVIAKANEDFRENADSVLSFIRDNEYVASKSNFITTSTLYDQYVGFTGKGSYPVSEKTFANRLEKLEFRKHRTMYGRGFFIEKLSVTPEPISEQPPF